MRRTLLRMRERKCKARSSEPGGRFFQQDAKAVDGAERRAQVVRNGVRKRLDLLVGRFQLGRPARDAGFQVNVEPHNFNFSLLALADVGNRGDKTGRDVGVAVKQRLHIDQAPHDAAVGPPVADQRVALRLAGLPGDHAGPLFFGHGRAVFAQPLPVHARPRASP
jgi:hypothetical protein